MTLVNVFARKGMIHLRRSHAKRVIVHRFVLLHSMIRQPFLSKMTSTMHAQPLETSYRWPCME